MIDRAGFIARMVGDNSVAWHAGKSRWKNLINLKLKPGVKNIEHNMILCYKKLVQMNLIDKKEIKLLNAWFLDYKNIQ